VPGPPLVSRVGPRLNGPTGATQGDIGLAPGCRPRPPIHFHDLRHHAGTLAAQLWRYHQRKHMERLGHFSSHASLTYDHSPRKGQREIADRMDEVLKHRPAAPSTS